MRIFICALLLSFSAAIIARGQAPVQSQVNVPAPTPYTIVNQDANSRDWQREVEEVGPGGEVVTNIQSYKELASGLNFWRNNEWNPSQDQISILSDGTAAATNGQHQAYFPANILSGMIQLTTPDGLQLSSQPVGLVYYDGANTAFIAVLTNSVGQIVGNNQIL